MANEIKDKKILIVDDEPSILDLYSEILTDAGFNVDTAVNGDDCLEKSEATKYDLILLDIMMNDGPSGIDVLKKIHENPDTYGKPIVVMLTNLALINAVKEAYSYGAEGYLVKITLSNDEIVERVKGFLKGFSG